MCKLGNWIQIERKYQHKTKLFMYIHSVYLKWWICKRNEWGREKWSENRKKCINKLFAWEWKFEIFLNTLKQGASTSFKYHLLPPQAHIIRLHFFLVPSPLHTMIVPWHEIPFWIWIDELESYHLFVLFCAPSNDCFYFVDAYYCCGFCRRKRANLSHLFQSDFFSLTHNCAIK